MAATVFERGVGEGLFVGTSALVEGARVEVREWENGVVRGRVGEER